MSKSVGKKSKGKTSILVLSIILIVCMLSSACYAVYAAVTGSVYDEHKVSTVTPVGTSINLFDYWLEEQNSTDTVGHLRNQQLVGGKANMEFITQPNTNKNLNRTGINEGHEFKFNLGQAQGVAANGWPGGGKLNMGMFKPSLVNGYPVLKKGNGITRDTDLSYLFDKSKQKGKASYTNVEGLLRVDADGYYYYNSGTNFASYNKASNSFDVYDTQAISNSKNEGQFFPFNAASDVFDVRNGSLHGKGFDANNDVLKHWFGLTMTTRFVQPERGMVGDKHMTYHFSGDDDVLVYIDDVLVGDLGGIHDQASLDIDFNTGRINIVCGGTNVTTNLRECYSKAKDPATISKLFAPGTNTFKKDTYHTLKFFYLERGNYESNLSLKFNLKSAPESAMHKVDADGKPVRGASFALHAIDESGKTLKVISTGVTGEDGSIVFVDEDGLLVDFNRLNTEGFNRYKLVEQKIPEGYRSTGEEVIFRYHSVNSADSQNSYGYLESENIHTTGAFAAPVEMVQSNSIVKDADSDRTFDLKNGLCFAVVLAKGANPNNPNAWVPVTGDPINGWNYGNPVSLTGGVNNSLLEAARASNWVLRPSISGSYDAYINKLPGRVSEYFFASGNERTARYTVAFYYTTADSLDGATTRNTQLVQSEQFQRTFGTDLFVPNIRNTFTVQKVNCNGDPVNNSPATFALYSADSISNGKVNPDAKPVETLSTDATDPSKMATVKFGEKTALSPGTYYLKEIKAPAGYVINEELIEIKVTSKDIFANAGTEGDGVYVQRSVGRLLATVGQFGPKGNINNTLTNVTATLKTCDTFDPDPSKWVQKNQNPIHLRYTDNPQTRLEYLPYKEGDPTFIGTDTGWSDLVINQCKSTEPGHVAIPREELPADMNLSGCFTGSVHIRVTNPAQMQLSKTVEGSKVWNGATFDFAVKPADVSTIAALAVGDISIPKEWEKITLTEAQKTKLMSFGDIKYKKAGKYSFKIKEKLPADKGDYLYSDEVYTLTVDVHEYKPGQTQQAGDPNRIGILEASFKLTDKNGNVVKFDDKLNFFPIGFVNVFNPTIGPDEKPEQNIVKTALKGTKSIVGRDFENGDEFSFKITPVSSNPADPLSPLPPLPTDSTGKVVDTVKINPTSGNSIDFNFESITFTSDDMIGAKLNANTGKYEKTFEYKITEIDMAQQGIDYDTAPVTVKITVEDDGYGNLKIADIIYSSGSTLNWTNIYTDRKNKDVKNDKNISIDGESVNVGDVLTYEVKWINNARDEKGNFVASDITITDVIPTGTQFVEGSAGNAVYDKAKNTLTWNITNAAPKGEGTVSFKVKVTESAIGTDIENTASIQIGNTAPKQTNKVVNFAQGKIAAIESEAEAKAQVGTILTYTIAYKNTETVASNVIITDNIPKGTEYVVDSATDGGVFKNGILSDSIRWEIPNVPSGHSATVSFKVRITDKALEFNKIENTANIKIGDHNPEVSTNTQVTPIDENGTLTLAKKVVIADGFVAPKDAVFSFDVTFTDKSNVAITKAYKGYKFDAAGHKTAVTVTPGTVIQLKADEILKIYDIEPGTKYTVKEVNIPAGFKQINPAAEGDATGSIVGGVNSSVEYTNKYQPEPVLSGEANLGGIKNLVGRAFEDGDSFKFNIYSISGNGPLPDVNGDGKPDRTIVININKNENADLIGKTSARFDFGKIKFTKPGTFVYSIREHDPNTVAGENALPSMSYDKTGYKLQFVVEDNNAGKLVVTSIDIKKHDHSNADNPFEDVYSDATGKYPVEEQFIFNNVYSRTQVAVSPLARKVLKGKDLADYPDKMAFGFRIEAGGSRPLNSNQDVKFTPDTNQPMPAANTSGDYANEHVYFSCALGNVDIPDIKFVHDPLNNTSHANKEYRYIISELQPTKTGAFSTNEADWLPGTTLVDGKLVYKGVTYDNSVKEVVVKVSVKKDASGVREEIMATITYLGADAQDTKKPLVFINKYEAKPVDLGKFKLEGTKHISGRDFDKNDVFTFEIKGIDNAPLPKDKNGNDVSSVTIRPENGKLAPIDFGTFHYTASDVKNGGKLVTSDADILNGAVKAYEKIFTYQITEKVTNITGITYDTAVRTVKVTVHDDGNGNLTLVKKEYTNGGKPDTELSWTNVFRSNSPKSISKEDVQITGNVNVGDVLTYKIKWSNNAQNETGSFVPATITITDTIPVGTEFVEGSAGNAVFDKSNKLLTWTINADAAATGTVSFKVKVTEAALKINKIENTGKIQIGSNNPVSTNTVTTPLGAKETFKVSKTVKVIDGQGTVIDTTKKFKFTVSLKNAHGEPLTGSYFCSTGTASGKISDGETIVLSHGQTAEISGLPSGVKFDVTEEAAPGYETIKTAEGNSIKFVNTYNAKPVDFTPSTEAGGMFHKVLTGRSWNSSDSFTFKIEAAPGVPMPTKDTVEVKNPGKDAGVDFGFGSISFKKAGTYEYTISEIIPKEGSIPGIEYDNSKLTLTIKVTDTKTGKLEVKPENVTITHNGSIDNTFINKYVSNGAVELKGTKSITGRNFESGDKFTFNIVADNGAPLPKNSNNEEISSVIINPKADNSANIDFGKLSFTQDDLKDVPYDAEGKRSKTFTYRISEVDEKAADMTYDTAERIVTVVVTDDGKGKLEVRVSGIENLNWTNVFTGGKLKDVKDSQNKGSIDGDIVNIGDELLYEIKWVNNAVNDKGQLIDSTITITDQIPAGTEFVEGSAGTGVYKPDGTLEWVIKAAAASEGVVSFKVRVTENAAGFDIVNQAEIKIGSNNPKQTNTVTNFVPGKSVSVDGAADAKAQIGKELIYKIRYKNTEKNPSDVVITDKIPQGTAYVDKSASNNGTYENGTIKWVIKDVPAGEKGTVTFKVKIIESAIKLDSITNTASVNVGANGPVVKTNTVTTPLDTEKTGFAIKKVVKLTENQGTEIDVNKIFTFKVKLTDVSGTELKNTFSYKIGENTASITSGGTIKLKHNQVADITGLPAGTKYTVEEIDVPNGYKVDTAIQSAPAKNNLVEFVNTYSIIPVEFTPTAADGLFRKEFSGRELKENDKFTFEISPVTKDAPMPAVSTVTIGKTDFKAEGDKYVSDFGFGTIRFDKAGEYVYAVKEIKGDIPGVTYDERTVTLKISVTDKNHDGTLTASAIVENGPFKNFYKAGINFDPIGAKFNVAKILSGRDMTDEQFSFEIKAKDIASEKALNIPLAGKIIKSPAAKMDTKVSIPAVTGLKFTEADSNKDYGFTIREVGTAPQGYEYDKTVYTVNIHIDDLTNGKLKAAINISGAGKTESYELTPDSAALENPIELLFKNVYSADSTKTPVSITATKVLNGRPLKANEFTFVIKDAKGTVVREAKNAQDGSIDFGKAFTYDINLLNTMVSDGRATISKANDGKNVFTINYTAEESGKLPAGVTATQANFNFQIKVTDNGDGTLTAKAVYPKEGLSFVNTYATEGGNKVPLIISGSKVLDAAEGLTPMPIEGKFTFTMTGDENAPLPKKTSVTNSASGNITFGEIVYTLDMLDDVKPAEDGSRTRVFNYTVTESGSVSGITNDPSTVREFTVTLKDDGKSKLTAVASDSAKFKFTNTYAVTETTSSVTDSIKITKKLTGRPLVAGEFNFELVNSENNVVSKGTNDEKGNILFDKVTYTKPGTFTYTVREVAGDKGGVKYDDTLFKVAAIVSDNGDGTLKVQHNAESKDFEFKNTYSAKETSVIIGAAKKFVGNELKDGQFTFELKDDQGKVISTAKNDKDGKILFDPITYDNEGTYKYTISEVNSGEKNVKYDSSIYNVTVKVRDDYNGNLVAEAVTDGDETVVFVNNYVTPDDGSGGANDNNSNADTGDNTDISIFTLLILAAGSLAALIRKRRNL